MLSRLTRGQHLLRQSSIPCIKFQICYLLQPCRNLSNTRYISANIADGDTIPPTEVKKLLATFLVEPGSEVKLEEIIERLPQLPANHHLHLNSALFLVTPSLAKAFEPHHTLHESIINHVFGQRSCGARPQSVVAVVDAIPKLNPLIPNYESIEGGEGIAMCISDRFGTVEEDGSADVPLVNFLSENTDDRTSRTKTISYLAPVANTLFLNGREHTMVRQDWKPDIEGGWIRDLEPVPLKYINIDVNDGVGKRTTLMNIHTTLEELTGPARVKSSMGNIVRELETSSATTISASAELEEIVPKLLKQRNSSGEEGELQVYALVYPETLDFTGGDIFKNLLKSPEEQPSGGKQIDGRMLRLLLKNGGRIYRVTSGGGGWGKRAGLLSLEPRVDVRRQDVPEPIMPEFVFGDEGVTMPDSKQLIPPGSVIQFLATFTGLKNEANFALQETTDEDAGSILDPEHWTADSWFDGKRLQTMCIGTSSVTELPDTDDSNLAPQHSINAETPQSQPAMIFSPNRFGLLSNSPMGIVCFLYDERLSKESTFADKTMTLSTKSSTTLIEPPGTSFTMNFFADGQNVVDTEQRVLSRQKLKPAIRRLMKLWRNENLISKHPRRSPEQIFAAKLRRADTDYPTVRMKIMRNARDMEATKLAKRIEGVANPRHMNSQEGIGTTADTGETHEIVPLDNLVETREPTITRRSRVGYKPGIFRKMYPFWQEIKDIEKKLSAFESSFAVMRESLETFGMSFSKEVVDMTSLRNSISERPRFSKAYKRLLKDYKDRAQRSRHQAELTIRETYPKRHKLRFQPGLKSRKERQEEYYQRNQIESQRLLSPSMNESEAATKNAVEQMSRDITYEEAGERHLEKSMGLDSFAVSLYGDTKDKSTAKTAVDDLMKGLKEEEEQ